MLNIRINRDLILDKLQTNLQTHIKEYKEAMENYRVAAVTWFATQLVAAKEGLKFQTYAHTLNNVPKNHQSSYERAIGLLKMGEETTVVLTEQDFAKFVQDDWEWKEEFRTVSASYGK